MITSRVLDSLNKSNSKLTISNRDSESGNNQRRVFISEYRLRVPGHERPGQPGPAAATELVTGGSAVTGRVSAATVTR